MNRGGTDITIDKTSWMVQHRRQRSGHLWQWPPEFQTASGSPQRRYQTMPIGTDSLTTAITTSAKAPRVLPKSAGTKFDNNLQGLNLGSRSFGSLGAPVLGAYAGTISGNTFSNNAFDGIQGGVQHVLITHKIHLPITADWRELVPGRVRRR